MLVVDPIACYAVDEENYGTDCHREREKKRLQKEKSIFWSYRMNPGSSIEPGGRQRLLQEARVWDCIWYFLQGRGKKIQRKKPDRKSWNASVGVGNLTVHAWIGQWVGSFIEERIKQDTANEITRLEVPSFPMKMD